MLTMPEVGSRVFVDFESFALHSVSMEMVLLKKFIKISFLKACKFKHGPSAK